MAGTPIFVVKAYLPVNESFGMLVFKINIHLLLICATTYKRQYPIEFKWVCKVLVKCKYFI